MGTRSRDAHEASRRKQGAWRTASLCAQIQRTLELEIAAFEDARFDAVSVAAVVPDGRASRMLILLRVDPGSEVHPEDIRAAFAGAEGRLRSEVAAAIHRKRTPHLHYVVLDPKAWSASADTISGDPHG